MSLFERLKNKRYELQEKKEKVIQQSLFSTSTPRKPRKITKKNPPPTKADYPKTRADLIKKRVEYGINKDGVPSKEGIKRYGLKVRYRWKWQVWMSK